MTQYNETESIWVNLPKGKRKIDKEISAIIKLAINIQGSLLLCAEE